jgi:hypothetical protein
MILYYRMKRFLGFRLSHREKCDLLRRLYGGVRCFESHK